MKIPIIPNKEHRLKILNKLVPKYRCGEISFAQLFEEMKNVPIDSIKAYEG